MDPRVQKTRQQILEAFLELNHVKSFEKITIQDIAMKAQINRSTFYLHFQDKYELMEEAIRGDLQKNLIAKFRDSQNLDENVLRELFAKFTEFYRKKIQEKNPRCKSSYKLFESEVERTVKSELQQLFHHLLLRKKGCGA